MTYEGQTNKQELQEQKRKNTLTAIGSSKSGTVTSIFIPFNFVHVLILYVQK
jgi:hypothetical protein